MEPKVLLIDGWGLPFFLKYFPKSPVKATVRNSETVISHEKLRLNNVYWAIAQGIRFILLAKQIWTVKIEVYFF